jgi:NAD(P)-dependent dehydrogenase (short-subunit alcohol dehydrogenase family)
METDENKPKRVLITGCSSGFGFLTALGAAREGFDVIATMRNPDKFGPLQQASEQKHLKLTIDRLDVTDAEDIVRIAEKYKPIDILVNNAGILITGSFLTQTDAEMLEIFETNYFGAVRLTRAVAPSMIERGGGRIINIASLAGLVGHPFNAAYAASKHALIGFSKSIEVELAPFGIDVVSIEPGYHKTEIIGLNGRLSENFYDRSDPMFEWNRGMLRVMFDYVLPRAGEPQEVADVILAAMCCETPKAHYVVGKEARLAMLGQWLGLMPWLRYRAVKLIRKARRMENKREAEKKNRKHRKKAEAGS